MEELLLAGAKSDIYAVNLIYNLKLIIASIIAPLSDLATTGCELFRC